MAGTLSLFRVEAVMTRRRLICMAMVACLGVVCLAAWLWFARSDSVRLTNHWRLRPGMTLTEVEAVLGGPAGNYASTPTWDRSKLNVHYPGRSETWISDEGIIIVGLDEAGRVNGWSLNGPDLVTPGAFERVRTWLGW